MANIQTRGTKLALVVETTEGTPVAPTVGTAFVPMQSDLSITPAFETQENDEMKGSLGKGKPIAGLENPTASMSLYLKHSGVEGQAPNYGSTLLKGIFGAEDDAGVEHDTVASSTVSLIKVDSAEGATYMRGQALMIKDPTNGYSIRPVHSISADDLVPGFDLLAAPASGVNLGQAITYYPVDSGHHTLSLWRYLGNSGAIDLVAGCRVTDLSINFESGQQINASYTLAGTGYYANPITIASDSKYIDFDVDGTTEVSAVLSEKTYKDSHDLAAAVSTAMSGLVADEITCTYSDTTGKFAITTDGTTLNLLWSTGTNAANSAGTKLGFTVSADDTGATTYTADNEQSYAVPASPAFDNVDSLIAKNLTVLMGDSSDNACFKAQSVSLTLGVPVAPILSMCSESGKSGSIATERTATLDVVGYLEKHDLDKFRRFRSNADTRFMLAFGEKSGGNWVAGKCACLYLPSTTITSYEVADSGGLYALNMSLAAYVDADGNGEVYLSFV